MAPSLSVTGPQLGAQNCAKKRTRDHPSHDHCAFVIEPDEVGRTPPDSSADWTIIAVDHPILRPDSLSDPADKFFRVMPRQIAPFRLPVDCIEFDMRQLQLSCNSACQSGFPGARCTDYHDPHQTAPPVTPARARLIDRCYEGSGTEFFNGIQDFRTAVPASVDQSLSSRRNLVRMSACPNPERTY